MLKEKEDKKENNSSPNVKNLTSHLPEISQVSQHAEREAAGAVMHLLLPKVVLFCKASLNGNLVIFIMLPFTI